MSALLDKLAGIAERYEHVTEELSKPEIIKNQSEYQKLAKMHAELEEIVTHYRRYLQVKEELAEASELLRDGADPEFAAFVTEERERLQKEADQLVDTLTRLLLPKDPRDDKNVIVEIRAGAGGEEAALFAGSLLRMYHRFAERQGWRVELLSEHATGLGGFKEVIFMVHGHGAFGALQYESGVHRVQRVPTTEASGRIHTSTATVAVLPEAEEVDVEIDPNDLRIDVFRSSGPGGQSVNTTDSAVRITHLPTGLVVSCQDEKSQHKNREKALRILRARLLDRAQQEQAEAMAAQRKGQVGTGDRSERIRTYNFPQGRVTDHRIGLTLHQLDQILDGDLDELIQALRSQDELARMSAAESER